MLARRLGRAQQRTRETKPLRVEPADGDAEQDGHATGDGHRNLPAVHVAALAVEEQAGEHVAHVERAILDRKGDLRHNPKEVANQRGAVGRERRAHGANGAGEGLSGGHGRKRALQESATGDRLGWRRFCRAQGAQRANTSRIQTAVAGAAISPAAGGMEPDRVGGSAGGKRG
eukprot:272232-Prymnesium_polylepis.1